MVNWKSPEVTLMTRIIFTRIVIFLLGAHSYVRVLKTHRACAQILALMYRWYVLESWHIVEKALVTRRIKFSLVHVRFFVLYSEDGQTDFCVTGSVLDCTL
jgi:hypothetical protein